MNRRVTIARVLAALLLAAVACDSGTGGKIVTLAVSAESVPEGASPLGVFTTDTGWSVVLTEASLVVGAVYAFAPDPDALDSFAMLVRPGIARAHGGIDPLSGRRVRAELLTPFVLDVLSAAPTDLGTISAEAGDVDAMELRLLPPTAAMAVATHGHHAHFAGTATKGAVSIDFEGGVDIDADGTRRRVEGIALDDTLDEGGALTLRVHAATFFRGAILEDLPPAGGSGVAALAIGSQPYEAVALGIRNPAAYTTAYVAGGAP